MRLDDIPQQVADDIQCFALMICNGKPLIYTRKCGIMRLKEVVYMVPNYMWCKKSEKEEAQWQSEANMRR